MIAIIAEHPRTEAGSLASGTLHNPPALIYHFHWTRGAETTEKRPALVSIANDISSIL